MTDLEPSIGGSPIQPATGWTLDWLDADAASALVWLSNGSHAELCLVEGSGMNWTVTLRGRRIPVTVRSWRERVLAEAESAARRPDAPVEVRATLPGLVVAVAVAEGDEVAAGTTLLTIEAMKMQNEVRAPRAGRVAGLVAAAGQPVGAGAPLLRIE